MSKAHRIPQGRRPGWFTPSESTKAPREDLLADVRSLQSVKTCFPAWTAGSPERSVPALVPALVGGE